MDCRSCNAEKANVHLTEVVRNVEKRELHLCARCAHQQGMEGMKSMGLLLKFARTPELGRRIEPGTEPH